MIAPQALVAPSIRRFLAAAIAAGALGAIAQPAPAQTAQAAAPAAPSAQETQLRAVLDQSLKAFNRGDFEGYLHDFAPRVSYNGLTVDRKRLVEINKELKETFDNLQMSYRKIRVTPITDDEATVTSVSDFTGSTRSYEGSGMPAAYREGGQITALYKRKNGQWTTSELSIAWNDSYIDIGQDFGVMGFTTLPNLLGAGQPFDERLYVGAESRPGVATALAYTLMPLSAAIEKDQADKVFQGLRFQPIGAAGVRQEQRAPEKAGSYVHVVVLNKYLRAPDGEIPLGQKIYTRLVNVE